MFKEIETFYFQEKRGARGGGGEGVKTKLGKKFLRKRIPKRSARAK